LVIIFDLDDTIYEENTFLLSGFKNVSDYLGKKTNTSPHYIYEEIISLNNRFSRDKIFNRILYQLGIFSKKELKKCISVYRYSNRKIEPYKDFLENILDIKRNKNIYLVTDGNAIVQKHKVNLLKIGSLFHKIFFTRNYGIKSEKPSLTCFKKIAEIEGCSLSDLIYIGDNIEKDFVNLNKVGATTIRLIRGNYSSINKDKKFQAIYNFKDFTEIKDQIKQVNQ